MKSQVVRAFLSPQRSDTKGQANFSLSIPQNVAKRPAVDPLSCPYQARNKVKMPTARQLYRSVT